MKYLEPVCGGPGNTQQEDPLKKKIYGPDEDEMESP